MPENTQIQNGHIFLGDPTSFRPTDGDHSWYTDKSGTKIFIPNCVLISLYETLKMEMGEEAFQKWSSRLLKYYAERKS